LLVFNGLFLSGSGVGRVWFSVIGAPSVTTQGKFDWRTACVDAAIIAGMTFLTGLGTLAYVSALSVSALIFLFSATGTEFLGIVAAKRGLVAAQNYFIHHRIHPSHIIQYIHTSAQQNVSPYKKHPKKNPRIKLDPTNLPTPHKKNQKQSKNKKNKTKK